MRRESWRRIVRERYHEGYGSTQSPFTRKVRAAAIETGQPDVIEWEWVPPQERGRVVAPHNPLVKIPAVVTDDGVALYDSPVICEYLDTLHDGPKLFPVAGAARWRALRLQALGDGLGDATVALSLELRRSEELYYDAGIERQRTKVDNALDALEREVDALGGALTIGSIAVACAVGYLDLRELAPGWRETRPAFAAWCEAFGRRPSMTETAP